MGDRVQELAEFGGNGEESEKGGTEAMQAAVAVELSEKEYVGHLPYEEKAARNAKLEKLNYDLLLSQSRCVSEIALKWERRQVGGAQKRLLHQESKDS